MIAQTTSLYRSGKSLRTTEMGMQVSPENRLCGSEAVSSYLGGMQGCATDSRGGCGSGFGRPTAYDFRSLFASGVGGSDGRGVGQEGMPLRRRETVGELHGVLRGHGHH